MGATYAVGSTALLLSSAGTYVKFIVSRAVSSRHVMVRATVHSRLRVRIFPLLASVDRLCAFDPSLVGKALGGAVPFQGQPVFQPRPQALSGALSSFARDAHN